MAEDKTLMTAQALAEALDLSVETIWRYTRENTIPHVQLGRRQYRYRLDEVLSTLNAPAVREKDANHGKSLEGNLTYDDYLNLPEEPGHRFEVLDGVLVREPSPSVIHQQVSGRIYQVLINYFRNNDPEGKVFYAPLDVTLGETTVVQPDLLYISSRQTQLILQTRIDGPPSLVIEILSSSDPRKDRLQKMQIYQDAGVSHYWIIDPEQRTMECLALREGTYGIVEGGMDDEVVSPPDFPGLSVDLKLLWQ